MHYTQINLQNGNSGIQFKIDSVSRTELDGFQQAVADVLGCAQNEQFDAVLYDLSSTGIILTPYAKHIMQAAVENTFTSATSRLAIVAGTSVLSRSLRTFFRLNLAHHHMLVVDIFADNVSAMQWLNEQTNFAQYK